MNTVVISVGSNINPHFNIKIAEEIISRELNLNKIFIINRN